MAESKVNTNWVGRIIVWLAIKTHTQSWEIVC